MISNKYIVKKRKKYLIGYVSHPLDYSFSWSKNKKEAWIMELPLAIKFKGLTHGIIKCVKRR